MINVIYLSISEFHNFNFYFLGVVLSRRVCLRQRSHPGKQFLTSSHIDVERGGGALHVPPQKNLKMSASMSSEINLLSKNVITTEDFQLTKAFLTQI